MMLPPNPGDLDRMVRDHQERLHAAPVRRRETSGGLRVVIGHALIALGTSLSGERADRPTRSSSLARTA